MCNLTKIEQYNEQFLTKILKDMPYCMHEHIEKHLILKRDNSTPANLG